MSIKCLKSNKKIFVKRVNSIRDTRRCSDPKIEDYPWYQKQGHPVVAKKSLKNKNIFSSLYLSSDDILLIILRSAVEAVAAAAATLAMMARLSFSGLSKE